MVKRVVASTATAVASTMASVGGAITGRFSRETDERIPGNMYGHITQFSQAYRNRYNSRYPGYEPSRNTFSFSKYNGKGVRI